jgi:hypothetical protein
MEIPQESLAVRAVPAVSGERLSAAHPEHVWFAEECRELILPSERYDFTIPLLLFRIHCRIRRRSKRTGRGVWA